MQPGLVRSSTEGAGKNPNVVFEGMGSYRTDVGAVLDIPGPDLSFLLDVNVRAEHTE